MKWLALLLVPVACYAQSAGGSYLGQSNVFDYGGSIQNALNTGYSRVFVPEGIYDLGTSGANIPTGKRLEGSNRLGTIVRYSGTGCAFTMDSTNGSSLRDMTIQVNSSSATARCVCMLNTTATSEYNVVENVTCVQTKTPNSPVTGQVGFLMSASTTNGLYWNRWTNLEAGGWDKSYRLVGYAANAPNQNYLSDLFSYASNYGLDISSFVQDTTVYGMRCSASGFAGTTCLLVGDGTNQSVNNAVLGLVSDQGVGPNAYNIQANAKGTFVLSDNESTGGDVDNGTNSTTLQLFASTSNLRVPQLTVNKSVNPQGTALKHVRGAVGCTTAASVGASCTSSAQTWPGNSWADTSYTVACSLESPTGQPHVVAVSKATGSFTITIAADTAVGASANYNCVGMHD